jgi:hypothetical protein
MLLKSATKIVLLLLVITLCVITAYITFLTGEIPPTPFGEALMLVLGFYFGKTTTNSDSEFKKEKDLLTNPPI